MNRATRYSREVRDQGTRAGSSSAEQTQLQQLKRVNEILRKAAAFFTQAQLESSVGSTGDSYDNALAETIIGLYKTEMIDKRGPWKNLEAVEYATLEWADWFNHRRTLEPIDNVPPAELEQAYYNQCETQTIAA